MLRYVFLSDGTSDKSLIPILDWLLLNSGLTEAFQHDWVDPARFAIKSRALGQRIEETLRIYPCDMLFIHRDAEKQPSQLRYDEIMEAMMAFPSQTYIGVVPIKMSEAWLLFNEEAIRAASGNPNGRQKLDMPAKSRWEHIPDPKDSLERVLLNASGLSTHRRQKFSISDAKRRVTDYIDDFSPLRGLSSFDALERDVLAFVQSRNAQMNKKGVKQ